MPLLWKPSQGGIVGETGFNSSPVTKGVLLRATKSAISSFGRVEVKPKDALSRYQEFFNLAYAEGAIDRKTKHLIALGASLAAGCDPLTRYCLAVARGLGATDEEMQETMAIAMTVGATKIKVLQENALASLPGRKPEGTKVGSEEESGQEGCLT
jgi:AhpD family alkylhydroperoxidase